MRHKNIIGLAGLALAFAAGWLINGWRMESQTQEAWQQERVQAEARLKRQEEIANEAQKDREKALADARAANDIAVRLRQRIEALARSACPAAAGSGQTTRSAGILLAELFRRADERAGELAEYADRARIAGQACEQAYDALKAGE
ncbi:MAG: DUF2514 domain-containing protein [Oxalobacter formigenes]|nr:DUF2514 domain-containing protein [Oxalobacter formigenes]